MSAILDALRKAQEERKDTFPGAARKEQASKGGSKRRLAYLALLLAVVLCVALWSGAGLLRKAPRAVSPLTPVQAAQGVSTPSGAQVGVVVPTSAVTPSPVPSRSLAEKAVTVTAKVGEERVSKSPSTDTLPHMTAAVSRRTIAAREAGTGSSERRNPGITSTGPGDPARETAEENVRVAAGRGPESDVTGLYNTALREGERGNLGEAKRLYLAVLKEKPGHIEALNNLGIISMREGKGREGLFYFRKALEVNPNYGKAFNNMGLIFLKEGDKGQAEVYFRKAIDVGHEKAEPTLNLSALYRSERKLAEASQLLDSLLKRGEDNPLVHLSYAIVKDEMGNPGEAIAHYRKFLQSAGGTAGATAVRERLKNLETANSVTVR